MTLVSPYDSRFRDPIARLVSLYHYDGNPGFDDPTATTNVTAWHDWMDHKGKYDVEFPPYSPNYYIVRLAGRGRRQGFNMSEARETACACSEFWRMGGRGTMGEGEDIEPILSKLPAARAAAVKQKLMARYRRFQAVEANCDCSVETNFTDVEQRMHNIQGEFISWIRDNDPDTFKGGECVDMFNMRKSVALSMDKYV
jgi:hypothetical protein